MASFTLYSVADRFGVGTSVGAYVRSLARHGAAPAGAATATSTVAADGSLTFGGLTEGTSYKAYALVGGVNVYVEFTVDDELGTASNPLSVESATAKTMLFAAIDVAASGDNTIVAAVASKSIVVVSYTLIADAAVTARWKDGATALSGAMALAANGGVSSKGEILAPLFKTTAGNALLLNLAAAVGARGHLTYYTV